MLPIHQTIRRALQNKREGLTPAGKRISGGGFVKSAGFSGRPMRLTDCESFVVYVSRQKETAKNESTHNWLVSNRLRRLAQSHLAKVLRDALHSRLVASAVRTIPTHASCPTVIVSMNLIAWRLGVLRGIARVAARRKELRLLIWRSRAEKLARRGRIGGCFVGSNLVGSILPLGSMYWRSGLRVAGHCWRGSEGRHRGSVPGALRDLWCCLGDVTELGRLPLSPACRELDKQRLLKLFVPF
jgi:hypothetical protein